MLSDFFVFLVLVLLIKYFWDRRWFYYYAFKIPGPSGIPLISPFMYITANSANCYEKIIETCNSQPPVFKMFVMNQLITVDTEPKDLAILLNTFLEKPFFYEVLDSLTKHSLLTAPVDIWKNNRKIIRRSFTHKTLALAHNIFVEYSKRVVSTFTKHCGEEKTDCFIFEKFCETSFCTALETLLDMTPDVIEDHLKVLQFTIRAEAITIERVLKFWLMVPLIWRFSRLRQEVLLMKKDSDRIIEEAWGKFKKTHSYPDKNCKKEADDKRFAHNLLNQNEKISEDQIIQETKIILIGASETSAATMTFTVVVLGLYPEIQDKIYEEICSEWSDGELPPESINRLLYTQRVIKEAMRLFPPVPLILRSIDKTIKLGKYTFPAGAHLVVPIIHLHRRADLWPDPLKFDPDRFLPENIKKRPKCAYMPFSYGNRNCIGFQYGLMSTKIMIAYIVKHFRITPANYRSVEDVDLDYHLLLGPKNCRVIFEKRIKSNRNT